MKRILSMFLTVLMLLTIGCSSATNASSEASSQGDMFDAIAENRPVQVTEPRASDLKKQGDNGSVLEESNNSDTGNADYGTDAQLNTEVSFVCAKFEEWFRQTHEIHGAITMKDILDTYLLDYLSYYDPSVLQDISLFKNAITLSLTHSNIGDISMLKDLTELGYLELIMNNISDISVISHFKKLNALSLAYNDITDISPLAGLEKLTTLLLPHNNIEDISSLEGLRSIEFLHLGENNISDVSVLGKLTSLENLCLQYNNIDDISVLAGLTNLKSLDLRGNPLSTNQIEWLRKQLPYCTIDF